MRRSLCGALGLLAAILSCPAFAETLPPADKPSSKVGDVIEYDARLATVACKRWEVTATNKDGSTVLQCGDNIAYISAANGNLTKIVSKSGNTLVEFDPQPFGVSFPLEVGKKWQGKYTGSSASTGSSWSGDNSCEVKPPEMVKVAAGQFDAYRIDCVDNWRSGVFSGQAHTSAWYAPKVGTTVKFVNAEFPVWDYQVTNITEK
jgi:hypothetical protein